MLEFCFDVLGNMIFSLILSTSQLVWENFPCDCCLYGKAYLYICISASPPQTPSHWFLLLFCICISMCCRERTNGPMISFVSGRYVGSRPIKLRKSMWKSRNLEIVRKKEKEKAALIGMLTGRWSRWQKIWAFEVGVSCCNALAPKLAVKSNFHPFGPNPFTW
jgi:hypothetical protein